MSEIFKFKSPIVAFKYLGDSCESSPVKTLSLEQLSEETERPEALSGTTYKLRSPIYDAALYITINDIVLNVGTQHEHRRPFEIFINSKAMESFQWIVALTRMISAVFRKGGDVTFIVDQLKSVSDPKGGYWKKGRYINSIVAEIAEVIELHFVSLGLLEIVPVTSIPQEKLKKVDKNTVMRTCPQCQSPTLYRESGCDSCLTCAYSKCG